MASDSVALDRVKEFVQKVQSCNISIPEMNLGRTVWEDVEPRPVVLREDLAFVALIPLNLVESLGEDSIQMLFSCIKNTKVEGLLVRHVELTVHRVDWTAGHKGPTYRFVFKVYFEEN